MNLLTSPRTPFQNSTLGTSAFLRWAFDGEATSSPNHISVYPQCLLVKSCVGVIFRLHKPACIFSSVSMISSLCFWILVLWLPYRIPSPSPHFPSLPPLFYLTSHQIYSWISTHHGLSRVSFSFGNFVNCKTVFSCVPPEAMTFWALNLLLWQFIRCLC